MRSLRRCCGCLSRATRRASRPGMRSGRGSARHGACGTRCDGGDGVHRDPHRLARMERPAESEGRGVPAGRGGGSRRRRRARLARSARPSRPVPDLGGGGSPGMRKGRGAPARGRGGKWPGGEVEGRPVRRSVIQTFVSDMDRTVPRSSRADGGQWYGVRIRGGDSATLRRGAGRARSCWSRRRAERSPGRIRPLSIRRGARRCGCL